MVEEYVIVQFPTAIVAPVTIVWEVDRADGIEIRPQRLADVNSE
jgi:hypothetical protein